MPLCKCGCGETVKQNYKHGHGRRGKTNSAEHNLAISRATKGHTLGTSWNKGRKGLYTTSDETKRKLSRIAKEKGFGKWMLGRKLSLESIQKGAEKRRGHVVEESTRLKISKANSGPNNGMYGRKLSEKERSRISAASKAQWQNPDTLAKREAYLSSDECSKNCRVAALKAAEKLKGMWYYNTKPELKMLDILDSLGINYVHSYSIWDINHCYCADFYIPSLKLVIEVDGKHWHNYPYGTDKDSIRNMEMVEKGYSVLRFWEKEFDLDLVRDQLNNLGWYRNG